MVASHGVALLDGALNGVPIMKRFTVVFVTGLVSVGATALAEQPSTPTSAPPVLLKYGDGKPDGKKSIAGTGEMVRFTLPNASQKLRGLRLHCARYGHPQAPDEDVEISIVSGDETEVVHTEFVPYAKFKRGESRWLTLPFKEEVVVPETFWVIVDFNAEQTKGVYLSFDTSSGGQHSKTGVPGGTSAQVTTGGDWMVQALLTKSQ
jgi:hypothetical protein